MTTPNAIEKNEILRLAALYELNILGTPPEERFDRITRLAALLLRVPFAYIAFLDAERQWYKSKFNLKQTEIPRKLSFCNDTIQHEGPMIIPDVSLDPRFADCPLVVEEPYARFYAGHPLKTPEGFKVGTLCVLDKTPRDLNEEELTILKDLAALAQDQLTLVDIVELEKQIQNMNQELSKAKVDLEMRNEFIRKAFSCYMSDEIVESLLQSGEPMQLGGEVRHITTLFSDLRNFTVLSENLSAERIVAALNTYYTKMVDIILKYRGTIDAIIGDALLVLFGAPCSSKDDDLRAVACAIEMQLAMKEVNEENSQHGLPELSMGIGINTGDAAVGNIGSVKRMKYSAIGAPVNLAARIQDFSLDNQILISETTLKNIRKSVIINGHLKVKMKGISSPVHIYDIGGVKDPYNLFLPK